MRHVLQIYYYTRLVKCLLESLKILMMGQKEVGSIPRYGCCNRRRNVNFLNGESRNVVGMLSLVLVFLVVLL